MQRGANASEVCGWSTAPTIERLFAITRGLSLQVTRKPCCEGIVDGLQLINRLGSHVLVGIVKLADLLLDDIVILAIPSLEPCRLLH